jgi:sec-independent protein translocase protein TatA
MGLGLKEILLIGIVLVIFFGPSRLPELGRSIGAGIKEFKKAKKEALNGRS